MSEEYIERPFSAYEGDEKYIFISYAHKDRKIIFPEIERFHNKGYPIWYDDGLTPGQEWDDEIAEALLGCDLLVVFISKNSMASVNVQDEIKLALEEKIDITPIYIEEAKLPPGLRLRLSNKHAIFKHKLSDNDYLRDCFKAFRKAKIPKINVEEISEDSSKSQEAAVKPVIEDDDSLSDQPSFSPYKGSEPYIFAAHAHEDSDRVFSEIERFNDQGFNVWYDDQTASPSQWLGEIEDAISNSALFVVFISSNAVESINLRNQIILALTKNKASIAIFLEETELKYGLGLSMASILKIPKYSMGEDEYVQEYLTAFKNEGFKSDAFDLIDAEIDEGTDLKTPTIDYAIDLGTSTSSIAKVDADGSIIILNDSDDDDFIASAVYVKRDGTILAGNEAKENAVKDPKNGCLEFKMKMGSNHVYDFEDNRKRMTPVGLSCEILESLRQRAKQTDLKSAVITVPCDFTAVQTKATVDAAESAGLENVVLLQEPAAVAMAYESAGLNNGEICLVYNFGAGSFDASIMRMDKEKIFNINNTGDTYLGGKLIDWDIVDKIFLPAIIEKTGLDDLNRNNSKYLESFSKLKHAAEKAKIELSDSKVSKIFIEKLLIGNDGKYFDFEYEMNRAKLEGVMEQYVRRTINHCRKALEQACLSIADVDKILLAGGSSLSPYVHQRLSEEFNIPLEYSINPKIVAVRGAAIFADTKVFSKKSEPVSGFVTVEAIYDAGGYGNEFTVNGKITNPDSSPEGLLLEFINAKTGWSSDKVQVSADGMFRTDLLAEDEYNIFEIKVFDDSNNLLNLAPDSINAIKYRIGIPLVEPILTHSLGFGLFGNELDLLAYKGTPLPFELQKDYTVPMGIHKGDTSSQIRMPLYQGNRIKADRNAHIGDLTISGEDVNGDLSKDSQIELKLAIDESGNIEGKVNIPNLGQELDAIFIADDDCSKDEIEDKFNAQKQRYNDCLTEYGNAEDSQIEELFNRIDEEKIIENIENFLKSTETDVDAVDKAERRINDFTDILDSVDYLESQLSMWNEIKKETDDMMHNVENDLDYAEPQIQKLFAEWKAIYNLAAETKNKEMLIEVNDKMRFIFSKIHENQIAEFAFLELASQGRFKNQTTADRLISKGNDALARKDMEELREIVGQLYKEQIK